MDRLTQLQDAADQVKSMPGLLDLMANDVNSC